MNDRWRKLEANNPYHEKCPVCKYPIYTQRWSEENWGCVESCTRCDECGYLNHYSYGDTELGIDAKQFYFNYLTSPDEISKIHRKFYAAIKRFKRSCHGNYRRGESHEE